MVGANIGHVFRCTDCLTIHTQPLLHPVIHKKKGSEDTTSHLHHPSMISSDCDQCGGSMKMFGPMWLGDLHLKEFMQPLIQTIDTSDTFDHDEPLLKRLRGMIHLIACELNVPFSHPIFRYASILKTTTPSLVRFLIDEYRGLLLINCFRILFPPLCYERDSTSRDHTVKSEGLR